MKHNKLLITGLALACTWVACLPVHAEVEHRRVNSLNKITFVKDDSWQPDGFTEGTSIPASYMARADIVLDGIENEPGWADALEVSVPLSYGKVESASLKAVYTDDEVFIRVRWPDATPDRDHHPWVWDSRQQTYVAGEQVEDSVMLSFEAGCEWTPSLLGGYMYDFDAWHWLAARSDPLGQALDLYGNVQDQEMNNPDFHRFESRVLEDSWVMKVTENHDVELHAKWDELDRVYMMQPVNTTLWLRAIPDGGYQSPPYFKQMAAPTDPPVDESQLFPQFRPLKLEGGAGEVSAKGHWQDGYWTVEFRRDRLTPARAIFDTLFNRLVQFSVHVFDHTEAIDEASESGRLFLQFLPDKFSEQQLLVNE